MVSSPRGVISEGWHRLALLSSRETPVGIAPRFSCEASRPVGAIGGRLLIQVQFSTRV